MNKKLEIKDLNKWGTSEQTETSRYQVMLTDKRDKELSPLNQPKINRFFETIEERNDFVKTFEIELLGQGGSMKHNNRLVHPCFIVFQIYNQSGENDFDVTVYN